MHVIELFVVCDRNLFKIHVSVKYILSCVLDNVC